MSEENLPDDDLGRARDNDLKGGQDSGNGSSSEPYPLSGDDDGPRIEQSPHDEPKEATNVPTLEEAAADVDAGEAVRAEEADASGDPATFAESPLSQFDPDDLEH